jgi:hypothetical protein
MRSNLINIYIIESKFLQLPAEENYRSDRASAILSHRSLISQINVLSYNFLLGGFAEIASQFFLV